MCIFYIEVIMSKYYIAWIIMGLLFGYFLMYITSNIVVYHGFNSNDVKNTIFSMSDNSNTVKYKFVPIVIQSGDKNA